MEIAAIMAIRTGHISQQVGPGAGFHLASLRQGGADTSHCQLAVLRESAEQIKHAAPLAQGVVMQSGIGRVARASRR
ncbi:MAG: hypothetical protein AB8E87_14655 [Prochlorococcus sp.]